MNRRTDRQIDRQTESHSHPVPYYNIDFFVHNWRALVRWIYFEAVDSELYKMLPCTRYSKSSVEFINIAVVNKTICVF